MSVFQVNRTVMAEFMAASGPASGAQLGMRPSTLPTFFSANVAAVKPPNESPHAMTFLTPLMAPALTCFRRSSLAWTDSAMAQPCRE